MAMTLRRFAALICLGLPLGGMAATYSGTGFFISSDGYIATNRHVIDGASEIKVRDGKGNVMKATVVVSDKANDIAVLKVEGKDFPILPLRKSDEIKKGTSVFTIGFPNATIQGRESKVTDGVISSLSGLQGEPNSFQISVPIQPGNSGGPLIDMTGAVVGLAVGKLSAMAMIQRSGVLPENVNYAVKSNYLIELISTDRNIPRQIIRTPVQKTLPLTTLVEKAEDAVVFIVTTTGNVSAAREEPRAADASPQDSRYARDAEAIETLKRGRDAYARRDYQEAVNHLGQAAAMGSAEAQNLMGLMYANGQGVAKDEAEAVKWYRKAVEQEYPNAYSNLGAMYANGRGVAKDDLEAVKWFRKAADLGNVYGQNNLGNSYEVGRGVPKDFAEAASWYRKAAERGYPLAQSNLAYLYARGNGVAKDDTEAFKWFSRAAEQDDVFAQYMLGNMYFNGLGIPRDNAMALKWFRRAADKGHAEAQNNLGIMYLYGRGVPRDESAAFKLFLKADAQGNSFAEFNLGNMYLNGLGLSKDMEEAVRWYKKAADKGHIAAQAKLKEMGR